jgi:hypothetical protein
MTDIECLEVQMSELTDEQLEKALNNANTGKMSVLGMGCGD